MSSFLIFPSPFLGNICSLKNHLRTHPSCGLMFLVINYRVETQPNSTQRISANWREKVALGPTHAGKANIKRGSNAV